MIAWLRARHLLASGCGRHEDCGSSSWCSDVRRCLPCDAWNPRDPTASIDGSPPQWCIVPPHQSPCCNANEMFRSSDELAILLRHILEHEGTQRGSTTLAVVASSGNLLATGHGEAIDSHSIIIRANGAPTAGYTADVGSRTSIRVLHDLGLADARSHGVTLDGELLLWTGDKQHPPPRGLSALTVDRAWVGLLHRTQLSLAGVGPSTGFVAMAVAVALAQRLGLRAVSLYGFGGCARCPKYYDCRSGAIYSANGYHPFATEQRVRAMLEAEGKICLVQDTCGSSEQCCAGEDHCAPPPNSPPLPPPVVSPPPPHPTPGPVAPLPLSPALTIAPPPASPPHKSLPPAAAAPSEPPPSLPPREPRLRAVLYAMQEVVLNMTLAHWEMMASSLVTAGCLCWLCTKCRARAAPFKDTTRAVPDGHAKATARRGYCRPPANLLADDNETYEL